MSKFLKDLHRLLKKIDRLTEGQVSIREVEWDIDSLNWFDIVIKPNTGYYKGGIFDFEICENGHYNSNGPPGVVCFTKILHPNMEYDELICLNILDSENWMPSIGLEGAILGVLFLLNNPNFDDPLNSAFSGLSSEDREEKYKKYFKGELEGYEFITEEKSDENSESCDVDETGAKDSSNDEEEEVAMEVDTDTMMDIETAVKLHNFQIPSEAKEETDNVCALSRCATFRYFSMDRVPLKSSQSCFPNFSRNVDFFRTKMVQPPKLGVCDGETVLMY